MADINRNPLLKDKFKEKHKLRNQLVISLKHHHHETLGQVPLDVAVNGMYKPGKPVILKLASNFRMGFPQKLTLKCTNLERLFVISIDN